MKKLLFPFLTTLLLFACHSEPDLKRSISGSSDTFESSESDLLLAYDYENDNSTPPIDRNEKVTNTLIEQSKIMKEGNMDIEVEDLSNAKQSIDSIVKKNIGYYEKEIFKKSMYTQHYDLKIRLPSVNFEELIEALETGIGVIQDRNINAKDVTEEYLDLEIRLDNNKAYLDRYKEMLNKASTIKEMIAIQEKIRQIEKEVDSNLGRMNYLSNRVQYSTLSLTLIQKPGEVIAEASPTFMADINDAFQNGFSGIIFTVIILANFWPIIIMVVMILLLRKKKQWFMIKAKVKS